MKSVNGVTDGDMKFEPASLTLKDGVPAKVKMRGNSVSSKQGSSTIVITLTPQAKGGKKTTPDWRGEIGYCYSMT